MICGITWTGNNLRGGALVLQIGHSADQFIAPYIFILHYLLKGLDVLEKTRCLVGYLEFPYYPQTRGPLNKNRM